MMNSLLMYSEEEMEGNEIPFGSLEAEVADDVPVMLSEGEYVVPADVVRYWGLKHLEEMRTMAKCGLMSMEMDGRLHKVDEDGEKVQEEDEEEVEEEVEEDDVEEMEAIAIEFDIDDMQEEMEEEEEEDDEIDFDGKKKIVHADAGGDIQRDREDNFGLGVGNTATLGISNQDLMSAMATVDMVDMPVDRSPTDAEAAAAVGGLANATREQISDVAGAVVDKAFSNPEPSVPDAVGKVAGAMGAVTGKFGIPGISNVTGPTVDYGLGKMNIGSGPISQAVAKASAKELATIGLNINLGLQDKTDLMSFGGNVVGISTGTMLGMPTQTIAGVVDPQMDVADYDRAVAAALGKDLATAPTNEVTGRPDFSKAQDLMGVQTDPDTGAPTTGGYTSRGDFVDVTGQVSAMGTAEALGNLGFSELADLESTRGVGGFFGLDESELEKAKQKATGRELADLEKQADMEKEQQEKEQQEMVDMMSEDETLGEVEAGPETEEGSDQQAEE